MSPSAGRRIRATVTVGWAAALAACGLGYTEPILADEDLAFEPRLLGTWADTSSRAWVEIARMSDLQYAITYHDDDGRVNRFEGLYGPFDGWRLLQLQPARPEPDRRGDFEESLLLRLYTFVEVAALSDSAFAIRIPEPDSVIAYVQRAGGRVPYTETDERLVVTASRGQLRAVMRGLLARPGTWSEPTWYVRRALSPPTASRP